MYDVVWSVNILIGVGLVAVAWVIYYILMLDNYEEKNTSHHNDNKTSDE